jgi:CubicO group peptidase (beta-lactamase class C family)
MANIIQVVAQVNAKAEQLLAEGKTVGFFVSIVDKDVTYLTKGYGIKSTLTGEPVDENTVFQLASISKVFGGTMISQLTKSDQLDIEAPVGIELFDPYVTRHSGFKDALSQRSGMESYAGNTAEQFGYKKDNILTRLKYFPITNGFRNGYSYQNIYYSRAVELGLQRAGYTDEEYWNIFTGQLGMTSTNYLFEDFEAQVNKAPAHWFVNAQVGYKPLFKYNTNAQPFAGGVSSNAVDMAKFVQYQVQQAFSPTTLSYQSYQSLNAIGEAVNNSESVGSIIVYQANPVGNERYKVHDHSGALEIGLYNEMIWSADLNFGIVVATNTIHYLVAKKLVLYMLYLMMEVPEPLADLLSSQEEALTNEATAAVLAEPIFTPLLTPIVTDACAICLAGLYNSNRNGELKIEPNGIVRLGLLQPAQLHSVPGSPNTYQAVITTFQQIPTLITFVVEDKIISISSKGVQGNQIPLSTFVLVKSFCKGCHDDKCIEWKQPAFNNSTILSIPDIPTIKTSTKKPLIGFR